MVRRHLMAGLLLVTAVGSAWAQEREWLFDTGDEDAYLVFGVPETDDAGVSFGCTLQSGDIRIFVPDAGEELKPDEKVVLTVVVDGREFTFDGTAAPDDMAGTTSAEAQITAGDALFDALRKADRFQIRAGSEENVYPLEGADFESLVRACTKG